MELDGKVVIVTGGGRGIGAATAELAASRGAKVVIGDINDEWGESTVKDIKGKGFDVSFTHVDVSDESSVEAMFKFAVDTYGKVDGIVNNAATIVVKSAEYITAEEWARVIGVNLTGVFYGSKHAILQFKKQGSGGSIVNMGSISAVVGLPEQAVYCASKGGVFQLSRQIAIDYAAQNIRCNTVGPGSVKGDFLDIYINNQSDPTTAREAIIGNHPISRLASPFEIGEAIVFLLSDRSSFVTGANLQADGGYSAI